MLGYIDGIEFTELDAEKYYAPPKSEDPKKTEMRATERIFSGLWYGSLKRDGYFSKVVKDEDGNVFVQTRARSRTDGKFPNKYEYVPQLHSFFDALPNGTVLLGELYLPTQPGSRNITTILGCLVEKALARQEKGEKLHLYVFDALAYGGKSLLGAEAIERFDTLKKLPIDGEEYVDRAQYYTGKELWDKLQTYLANGEEGMVITRGNSKYLPGKRTTKDTLKIKKELAQTLDVVIIGANAPTRLYTGKDIENWKYWVDTRTQERIESYAVDAYSAGATIEPVTKAYYYNWAGSLKLGLYDNDGNLHHIGNLSGVSDEVKANWRSYVGKVAEIGAMEIMKTDSGYGLRHAKFLNWREDKEPKECMLDQLQQ